MNKRSLEENQRLINIKNKSGQKIVIVKEGTYNKKVKDWELNNELCNHPTWLVNNLDRVLNQNAGCPKCANVKVGLSRKIPADDIASRLEGREVVLVKYGKNTNTPDSEFACKAKNHKWVTSFASVVRGSGCAKCSNIAKLTKEEVCERLKGRHIEVVKYSGLVGQNKSEFKCTTCSNVWKSTVNNVFNGKGCPACAKTGFNPIKPGWVYILLLDTPKGYCYGFGITNTLKDRMRRHKKNLGNILDYEYPPMYFSSGIEAQALEAEWKKSPYVINIGIEGFMKECVLVNDETTKMIFG